MYKYIYYRGTSEAKYVCICMYVYIHTYILEEAISLSLTLDGANTQVRF